MSGKLYTSKEASDFVPPRKTKTGNHFWQNGARPRCLCFTLQLIFRGTWKSFAKWSEMQLPWKRNAFGGRLPSKNGTNQTIREKYDHIRPCLCIRFVSATEYGSFRPLSSRNSDVSILSTNQHPTRDLESGSPSANAGAWDRWDSLFLLRAPYGRSSMTRWAQKCIETNVCAIEAPRAIETPAVTYA